MKTLAAIVLLAAALSAGAQMYSNSITGELASALPNPLWLNGWKSPPSAEDYTSAGWVALTAEQVAAAALSAQEQAAQIVQLAQAYGPMVSRLQANMVLCGFSIPVSPQDVMAALLAQDAAGTLTEEKERAMSKVFMIHSALLAAGLSNADIAAIWEAIKP